MPLTVVEVNILFNDSAECGLILKLVGTKHLGLYEAPEALSRIIVNTVSDTGHRPGHALRLEFHLKSFGGILKITVAVKDWLCTGIHLYRLVKRFEYKAI
ncbi:MAG: hypothetical protein RR297_06165, partial [Clostridia bacterium]